MSGSCLGPVLIMSLFCPNYVIYEFFVSTIVTSSRSAYTAHALPRDSHLLISLACRLATGELSAFRLQDPGLSAATPRIRSPDTLRPAATALGTGGAGSSGLCSTASQQAPLSDRVRPRPAQ